MIGIMQPYFFPYIGYFQLIQSVDSYVNLDHVAFMKRSYMTRNVLKNEIPISIPVSISVPDVDTALLFPAQKTRQRVQIPKIGISKCDSLLLLHILLVPIPLLLSLPPSPSPHLLSPVVLLPTRQYRRQTRSLGSQDLKARRRADPLWPREGHFGGKGLRPALSNTFLPERRHEPSFATCSPS